MTTRWIIPLSRLTYLPASLAIATLCLLGSPVRAREGLRATLNDAPAAVRAAWPATFAYLGPDRWGTAFAIGRRAVGSEVEVYFVTANHVVDAKCAAGAQCRNTVLVKNMRAWNEPRQHVRIAPTEAPSFDRVYLVERVSAGDVAVIATRVPAHLARGLSVIHMSGDCLMSPGEPLYSVGFSATMDRLDPHGMIAEPAVATKRWAEGLYVGDFLKTVTDLVPMVGTTVDGITGHSGAAVINARGEVVSIYNQTALKPDRAYDGNETPGHLDWHSLGASCEIVRRLGVYQTE